MGGVKAVSKLLSAGTAQCVGSKVEIIRGALRADQLYVHRLCQLYTADWSLTDVQR